MKTQNKLSKGFVKRAFALVLVLSMLVALTPKQLLAVKAAEGTTAPTNLALATSGATRISNLVGKVDWIENIHNGEWDDAHVVWVHSVTNATNGTTEELATNDYIGYEWATPVTANKVVLVTSQATNQGPCAWHIEVTKDGNTWSAVDSAQVTDVQWQDGNQAQAKTLQFEKQEDITGLRVCIDKVHSAWSGYRLNEIEVYNIVDAPSVTPPASTPSVPTVTAPANGNYADATIAERISNLTLNDVDNIQYLNDGNDSLGFWRKNMTSSACTDWIGYKWAGPISVNQIVVTVGKGMEQAPVSWRVEVSGDGETNWTQVATVTDMDWKTSNNIDKTATESKVVKFDLQENIKGIRICIDKINNAYGGYSINELKVYNKDDVADPTTPQEPTVKVPENGNYALVGERVTNLTTKQVDRIEAINDGKTNAGTWRKGTAAEIEGKDYYGYKWDGPVSIDQVVLVVGKAKEQAPTAWHVEVSKDGETGWTKVGTVSAVDWKTSNNIDKAATEVKSLTFKLQENIKGIRVYIDKANLTWGGYSINEIEVYNSANSSRPATGDIAPIMPVMMTAFISAAGVVTTSVRLHKNRKRSTEE